jgi:hypothetical protein
MAATQAIFDLSLLPRQPSCHPLLSHRCC